MTETSTNSLDQGDNPIDLAIPVAQRVEIRFILLESSATKRGPDALQGKTKIEVTKVEFGRDDNAKMLFVRPSFKFTAFKGDESSESEPTVLIEASFILMYSVESFDGLEHKNLHAFAATNAIHNVWPYSREFAQSTSVRMGIPAVTVPVFLFRQAKVENSLDDQTRNPHSEEAP